MPVVSIDNFAGLNINGNPISASDGDVVQAINVVVDPFGGYLKRPGYVPFLGTPDNAQINSLWGWYRNDGSTFNLYRASGSIVYYSLQGTGAWTVPANGTITNGSAVGHEVLSDVMIIGDGVGSTRHSTNGTTFVNTTLAPISPQFVQYQDRIYATGTTNTFSYSAIDDATNWNTSGTSDSSSINIPGEGKILTAVKNADRLLIHKNAKGQIYKWDGASLTDMATAMGMSSPYAYGSIEHTGFWLNRQGLYAYFGDQPTLISSPIQSLVYNTSGSAITGANFDTAQGVGYYYDYLITVGTTTDDFTGRTVSNAILKYEARFSQWSVWQFNDNPTCWAPIKDNNKNNQLLFGNASGQVFQYGGTATSDNGTAIQSVLEFIVHAGSLKTKNWYRLRIMMNPGCEAQVEVAATDTFTDRTKKYYSPGQVIDGVLDARIPSDAGRSRFLFVKISDNSLTSGFSLYGAEIDYDFVPTSHDK